MQIPTSILCDPGHAEIAIVVLLSAGVYLLKIYRAEKKKNESEFATRCERIESKLDKYLADHSHCRETLTERFVSRAEFADLIKERNDSWKEFNRKFEELIERFSAHTHDEQGGVKHPVQSSHAGW